MQLARLTLLGLAILALVVACWLTGCGGTADVPAAGVASAAAPSSGSDSAEPSVPVTATSARPRPAPPKPVDPIVLIHTSAGDIQLQLFIEKAPQSVDNFLRNYALRGFYDGTIFHHVEAGSMLIGGGYTQELEPKETRAPVYNESQNGLKNTRGAVAMIRDPENTHSATSQFFINLADNPSLDFQSDETDADWGYCVFGQVVAGMDIVDSIAQASVEPKGEFAKLPATPIVITSVERVR
jgi:peptidyl-prolyl cis-trans isomerase A (cyclophilin A)